MRLHMNLLTLGLATAVAVPVALFLPVATAPAATPHPVKPGIHASPSPGWTPRRWLRPRRPGWWARPRRQARPTRPVRPVRPARAGPRPSRAPRGSRCSRRPERLLVLAGRRRLEPRCRGRQRTDHGAGAYQEVGGDWSTWSVLDTSDSPRTRTPRSTSPVQPQTEPTDREGVRRRAGPGRHRGRRGAAGMHLDLIDPGSPPADGAGRPPLPPRPPRPPHARSVSRAQWGADESLRDSTFKYTAHGEGRDRAPRRVGQQLLADRRGHARGAAKDIRRSTRTTRRPAMPTSVQLPVDQAGRIYEGRAGGVTLR